MINSKIWIFCIYLFHASTAKILLSSATPHRYLFHPPLLTSFLTQTDRSNSSLNIGKISGTPYINSQVGNSYLYPFSVVFVIDNGAPASSREEPTQVDVKRCNRTTKTEEHASEKKKY